jgi:hypothetical protein
VLLTPTPHHSGTDEEEERRPAVAASTRLLRSPDVSPSSAARLTPRRLGNTREQGFTAGQKADRQGKRRGNRRRHGRLRHQLRGVTSLPRLKDCGAKTVNGLGGPVLRITGEETNVLPATPAW